MTTSPPVILVVEDDPDIAEMLRLLVPLAGYAVVLAGTGAAALAHLQQHTPDLIVSDLYLPEGDGWSIYQHLRAQPHTRTLPFLLLTAAYDVPIAAPDPFLRIIAKPFQPDALFTCMRVLLVQAAPTP